MRHSCKLVVLTQGHYLLCPRPKGISTSQYDVSVEFILKETCSWRYAPTTSPSFLLLTVCDNDSEYDQLVMVGVFSRLRRWHYVAFIVFLFPFLMTSIAAPLLFWFRHHLWRGSRCCKSLAGGQDGSNPGATFLGTLPLNFRYILNLIWLSMTLRLSLGNMLDTDMNLW